MKQLFAILLVYVFLISNSCNHSKISLGKKHDHKRVEQVSDQRNPSNQDLAESEEIESNAFEATTDTIEKKSLEERTVEQLDQLLDEESSETFHAVIEKSKLKKRLESEPEEPSKKKENSERNAATLVIFGILLLLAGVALVLYSINKVTVDSTDSVDGCIITIINGILLTILAIMLGVFGLIMIVIGMVVYFNK